jgi:aldehyde dehydrogenase (NAD+)
VVARTGALKLGTANDADIGPLISERQLKKVSRMVDEALERGAKVLTKESGSAAPSSGYYYRPTLLSDVETDTELWNEEVFGPVVAVKKFETDAEAIQIANDSKYGLTAAVHTTSLTRQLQYSKQLCSGVVNVNLGTYGSEPHMSFGGFKHSGNGTREPGDSAINVYTELKYISVGI